MTVSLAWTRAPIEDGVDGAGVYASRLRPRRSARSPQSPKVLGPGGAHARREIGWGRKILHSALFWYEFGSGGEPVDGYGARVCVSRKLHPLGGEHALLLKKGPGRPGAWGIRNETWPASCDDDGFLSREDLIGGAGIRMKRWLRPCCERGCRRL